MRKLIDMIGHTIENIPCKHCGSEDTYIYEDEEFDLGSCGGSYSAACKCRTCGVKFYPFFNFKYEITAANYDEENWLYSIIK